MLNKADFVDLLISKMSDLRKDPHISRMRVFGFRCETCQLEMPSFEDVKATELVGRLKKYGEIGRYATAITEVWHKSYSWEQANVIERLIDVMIKNNNSIALIEMPTGSGKTEAFMIPGLANALTNGLSIFVYPRRALASDQVARLALLYILLKKHHKDRITPPYTLLYDGDSCRDKCEGEFKRIDRVKEPNTGLSYKLYYTENGLYTTAKCEYIGEEVEIPLSDKRLELVFGKELPRVLVTNYDMLNRMLSGVQRITLTDMISNIRPKRLFVVFDEAHEYQGLDFLHMVALILRIYQLVKRYRIPLHLVLSSATIPKGFNNIISRAVEEITNTTITVIKLPQPRPKDYPSRKVRNIKIAIMLPDPETAGQWLYQLALLLTSIALEARNLQLKENLKAIGFVDSIRYQHEILKNVKQTLFNKLEDVVKAHISSDNLPLQKELDWSDILLYNYNVDELIKRLTSIPTEYDIDKALKSNPCKARGYIAIHNAGLDVAKRVTIETALRECKYPRLVVATPTLEVGVDIPSAFVVLQFRKPPSPINMMQRLGRVARHSSTDYVGACVIVLTSQPSDAILLLNREELNRYLYGCKNIKAPPPQAELPLNEAAILQHALLTALSLNPPLARNLEKKQSFEGVLNTIRELLRHLNDDEVRRYIDELIRALRKAYEGERTWQLAAKILDTKRIVEMFLNDLKTILETTNLAPSIAEEIDKVINSFKKPLTDLSYILEVLRDAFALQVPRNDIQEYADYAKFVSLSEEERNEIVKIIGRLPFDEINSIKCSTSEIIKSLSSLKKETLKHIRVLQYNLHKICDKAQDTLEDIREVVEELASKGLIKVETVNNLKSLLSQIRSLGRSICEVAEKITNITKYFELYGDHNSVKPIELLAILTGKPYYSYLTRAGAQQIILEVGSHEKRAEDPVSALWKLVPLSIL